MTNTFVERHFDSPRGDVIARFEAPYPAPGGEYRCRWHLIDPDGTHSSEAAGIDGVQALTIAMRRVHSELAESADYKAGGLTYLGESDLGLPPPL